MGEPHHCSRAGDMVPAIRDESRTVNAQESEPRRPLPTHVGRPVFGVVGSPLEGDAGRRTASWVGLPCPQMWGAMTRWASDHHVWAIASGCPPGGVTTNPPRCMAS
jgi:hypothetical protein